jgi:tetratricopeptide (TPR) repeat protein
MSRSTASRAVALPVLLVLAAGALAALAVAAAGPGAPAAPPAIADSGSAGAPAAAPRFTPASFRFTEPAAGGPAAGPAAPISLTASDGTGLRLAAVSADGVLEPPLAFTELRLSFDNPRDEVIEGRFRIALPPGAAISRFAMEIGGRWQEGEVVERQLARRAYEDFLHRRQDPALLEQEAGNEFSARVFPIPARGRKELIVSYSQPLARADQPYVLPLLGLPEIGALDVRVLLGERPAAGAPASSLGGEVRDRRVVELHKRAWTPEADFTIGQDAVAERSGLRHGNLAVVRVAAPIDPVPQEISGLYALVDSSASRALGYPAQVRRLGELLAGLREGAGPSTPLGVAVFDQEVVPVFEGAAGGFGAAELRRLEERRPLGASDLHRALRWLAGRLEETGERHPRVLVVTDGVATAGETEIRALRAAVAALGTHGVERLDVLAVGGLRDEAVLRALTTGNLPHDGQPIDGAAPLAEIARRLTLACRSGIEVGIQGAAWVWPTTLDGVQPGDQVLVYADLPAGSPLRLTVGGLPHAPGGEIAPTERPLLERAWVQARIERLLHLRETVLAGDPDLRRAAVLEVVELSVRHRVLSPFTALLVLETEADYRRYGLDRMALADVLTVGSGGIEVAARTALSTPPAAGDPALAARGPDPEEIEALGYLGGEGGEELVLEAGAGDAETSLDLPRPMARRMAQVPEADGVESPLRIPMPDEGEPGAPPPPETVTVTGTAPVVAGVAEEMLVTGQRSRRRMARSPEGGGGSAEPKAPSSNPHDGRFAEVMAELVAGRPLRARTLAEAWSAEAPGDVLALLALGEAWEATGETAAAARAYGSLIDLFPGRADLRRLAGERLERLGEDGLALAIDTYRKAVLDRPDHPSGHRLLAWALLRSGRFEEAFAAAEIGLGERYPDGRFRGVERILREDLGLLASAWSVAEPARRDEILGRLHSHGGRIEVEASLRFVLTWETDANDVDLHVWDRRGAHAYYQQRTLPSGGELYADVTTGFGPECFTIRAPERRPAAPYRLAVHYYRRGPMGYGMGTVQVVEHDGRGGLRVESRPFVVMTDDAMLELGSVPESGVRRAARR